jgi:DNA-nicking Smr family endonuclease
VSQIKFIADISLMTNKPTDSSTDDFALFREEMSDATPLEQEQRVMHQPKPLAAAVKKHSIEQPFDGETFSDMFAPETVGNEDYLEYRGPGIQHRQFAKLRSGKVHLEAELDLHGMTISAAEPALSQFLEQCQQQGIRCVRVIHGKGWGSRDNKPVLKSKLNYWLRQSSRVLAFCSATIADGGTGALYVLIKRLNPEG